MYKEDVQQDLGQGLELGFKTSVVICALHQIVVCSAKPCPHPATGCACRLPAVCEAR